MDRDTVAYIKLFSFFPHLVTSVQNNASHHVFEEYTFLCKELPKNHASYPKHDFNFFGWFFFSLRSLRWRHGPKIFVCILFPNEGNDKSCVISEVFCCKLKKSWFPLRTFDFSQLFRKNSFFYQRTALLTHNTNLTFSGEVFVCSWPTTWFIWAIQQR